MVFCTNPTITMVCNCINNIIMVLDTNECGNANGGCEHYCNNTVGSFTCSCNTGFELAEDNLNCTGKELQLTIGIWDCFTSLACVHADVDECAASTDRCAQTLLVAIGVVVVQDIL